MKLDVGRCFEEALDVFVKNWLILIVAGLLFTVLSVVSLLILMGPLTAGFSLLALKALQREDHRVDLSDLFGMFPRFLGLLGLFFLTLFAELLGFAMLLAPGLFLTTIWMFAFYVLVDEETGVIESLSRSQDLVFRAGFWNVFVLMLVDLALGLLPTFIPVVGTLVSFATVPLGFLVVAAGYRQLTAALATDPVQALSPQTV